MQINSLYIGCYLVLLRVVYANQETTSSTETTSSNEQKINFDPLVTAISQIEFNKNHFRKELKTRRQRYAEALNILHEEDIYYLKFTMIKHLLTNIVNNINESIATLKKERIHINDKTFNKQENVQNALFLLIESTALFGDLIYHYPDITIYILKIEKQWNDKLTLSLIYTIIMQDLLDDSTLAVISLTKEILRNTKGRLKFKKEIERDITLSELFY